MMAQGAQALGKGLSAKKPGASAFAQDPTNLGSFSGPDTFNMFGQGTPSSMSDAFRSSYAQPAPSVGTGVAGQGGFNMTTPPSIGGSLGWGQTPGYNMSLGASGGAGGGMFSRGIAGLTHFFGG